MFSNLAFMVFSVSKKSLILFSMGHGQTRSHGGAYRGRAPPNDCLCPPKRKLFPPKRGLCPEENNRLGATGVQIEAQNGVFQCYFCAICGLTPDFMTFLG